MYSNGQTLRHKTTNAIVRLAVSGDSSFAWSLGKGTRFIDAEGKPFIGDSNDYIYIANEFGEPQCGAFHENGPDLTLKRYIVSESELKAMRRRSMRVIRKRAIALEAEVLKVLAGGKSEDKAVSDYRKTMHCVTVYGPSPRGFSFMLWFLKRRKAKALYRRRVCGDRIIVGAYTFRYGGIRWVHEYGRCHNGDLSICV